MGGLLSKKENNITNELVVDFENSQPTESERDLYDRVAPVLERSQEILKLLSDYRGAEAEVGLSISKPSREADEGAWQALVPRVITLKDIHDFSQEICDLAPRLWLYLCTTDDVMRNLTEKQAIVKQFADLLFFIQQFDHFKMTNPSIQNDFSSYRRMRNRLRNSDNPVFSMMPVTDEAANVISFFYADATPMLNGFIAATNKMLTLNASSIAAAQVSDCLAKMATVCQNIIHSPERFRPDTIDFTLRVLVSIIVLFDQIDQQGAFHKGTPINMKLTVKTIKDSNNAAKESLLNMLRYSTKHFKDESTPKNIKALLE